MKMIMNVYSSMRMYKNSQKFEKGARDLFKKVFGDDINHVEYVQFLNIVGDNYLKIGGKEGYQTALDCYLDASSSLNQICGEESMDFILSLIDIGDVYLEQKEFEKAKSFYLLGKNRVVSIYGENSIFL
jgi:hypothetical protein